MPQYISLVILLILNKLYIVDTCLYYHFTIVSDSQNMFIWAQFLSLLSVIVPMAPLWSQWLQKCLHVSLLQTLIGAKKGAKTAATRVSALENCFACGKYLQLYNVPPWLWTLPHDLYMKKAKRICTKCLWPWKHISFYPFFKKNALHVRIYLQWF